MAERVGRIQEADMLSETAEPSPLPEPSTQEKKQKKLPEIAVVRFLKNLFNFREYLRRMCDTFGWKFVSFLTVYCILDKGLMWGFYTALLLPFFNQYVGVAGDTFQDIYVLALLPWSMKGFFGSLSDVFPFLGFYKRHYMSTSTVVGVCAYMTLIFLSTDFMRSAVAVVGVLLFLGQIQRSVIDMLVDAKVAEYMVKEPAIKGDAVSYISGLMYSAMMVALACCVPLLKMNDGSGGRVMFIVFACGLSILLYPILRGWLPEERVERAKANRVDWGKAREHWKLFTIALLTAVSALGLGVVQAVAADWARLGYLLGTGVLLMVGAFWLLTRLQARVILAIFLLQSMYIRLSGGVDYWFTADEKCVPGGPDFSMTYYVLVSRFVGTFALIVSVWIFQAFIAPKWTFRWAFMFGVILKSVAALFDIVIVLRWNLAIGIGDRWWFVFGSSMLAETVEMFDFLTAIILISRVTDTGVESTTIATLSGFWNYAIALSRSLGSMLMRVSGIRTTVPCDFRNLPLLLSVGQVVLPLALVPFVFCLVPNVKFADPLEDRVQEEKEEDGEKRGESEEEESRNVEESSGRVAERVVRRFPTATTLGVPNPSIDGLSEGSGEEEEEEEEEEDSIGEGVLRSSSEVRQAEQEVDDNFEGSVASERAAVG
uniref:Uncharacterized protein n=1 Tax=Chromera velia CCMP2878 TaxID=1169474 RepID=A0A0G4IBF0_9ALVE|eukprot:Cvel_12734.t1-p1 / transcript=Cvel_12734.t1 / gene=Cvel_12734 / organism=Chromera_velia_CCMP2878 / gene_product=Probable folate-biopterin transporter 3, putative / transcript_product=Probable folate-biopterin transporter 3, putative / location=Cvel_scaffold846:32815-36778(-) / protein_length=655 / sequence_SO=supercontig / SO=protein_coding / is_pseudo=false